MVKDERSKLTLGLTIVTLILLSFAYVSPWWIVEESTGRQTAPDGPQDPDDTQVVRRQVDFYVDGWRGDLVPADEAAADNTLQTMMWVLITTAAVMAILFIGELPFFWKYINRHVGIALAATALVGVTVLMILGWVTLPQSMAEQGIDGPFTHLLLEDGYIRSNLYLGWGGLAFAWAAVFAAGLAKFGAGNDDPSVIEEYRVTA